MSSDGDMRPALLLALSASTPPLTPPRVCVVLKLDDKMSKSEAGKFRYALQNLVQRGEAATLEEAHKIISARGYASALHNMVDRGDAASLDEARQLFYARRREAALQMLVDGAEAATLKEAAALQSSRAHAKSLENMVDRGEVATLEAAQQVRSMYGGVSSAIKAGKNVRFPGVTWSKQSQKWRVQFRGNGKLISLGLHASEELRSKQRMCMMNMSVPISSTGNCTSHDQVRPLQTYSER